MRAHHSRSRVQAVRSATRTYFGALTTTIRLADAAGANVGEATLDDVSWTYNRLSGGLYYWTTSSTGVSQTEIRRYNFADAGGKPETYWSQTPDSPALTGSNVPPDQAGAHACMGCHAISHDGSKIALSFGGSLPAAFELIDVASKTPIAQRLDTTQGFASMTSFSPDNSRLINEYHGKLLLRDANAMLTDVSELFATRHHRTEIASVLVSARRSDHLRCQFNFYRELRGAGTDPGDLVPRFADLDQRRPTA